MYTRFVKSGSKTVRLTLAAAAISAAAAAAVASRPAVASAPEDSDQIVRVTAVVTDRKGQPLAGLKPADFELLVDGKPQAVDSAEMTNGPGAPRAFGILLDEFHTSPGDSTAVRERLLRFVDRQLRPADMAFVVKPLDSLLAIKATAERAAVRQAIETFEGRKGDYTPRTLFERNYMAQAPAAVAGARGQIVTSALRAIGVTLSQTSNARGAIVLVSDGFERMRTGRDVPANLQTTVRIANRADAPVYAFAPALAPPPADGSAPPDPAFSALRALTTQTGGVLITGSRDFESGLARMTHDLDRHYVLTYRPEHGSDGKFHAVQVSVKREGVEVRARSGYVAPASAVERAAAVRASSRSLSSAPVRVLRRSNLIQSWSGVTPAAPGRATVTLTWEPAAFRAGSPARGRASTVVVTATDPAGSMLFDGPVGPALEQPSDEVPNRATFEAPAGPIRVDMKILDAQGVVVDTDARDINVPAVRTEGPTLYPASIIRARSAREFREALESGSVSPVATRDFRRTDRLLVRIAALDPSGAAAPVEAVLLNRWRHAMRDVPRFDVPDAPPSLSHFDLPLASLAPGEYTLRLTVTHDRGTVSEHVTFRVAG